jgi:hypothetical protein
VLDVSIRREPGRAVVMVRVSEQILFLVLRMSGLAQPGRTAGSFHGQDQDQEGLVEMAVVELGGFSKGVGDELVSGLQFVQDGRFHWHRTEGSGGGDR